MTAEPYGIAVFCDDIRQEINGKLTLVGCYGPELRILGTYPTVLPILAAQVNIRVPGMSKIESLRIVVTKEDADGLEEILSMEPDTTDGLAASDEEKSLIESGEKIMSVSVGCKWSPIQFTSDSKIKVRAFINGGEEVKLGSLYISAIETTEASERDS